MKNIYIEYNEKQERIRGNRNIYRRRPHMDGEEGKRQNAIIIFYDHHYQTEKGKNGARDLVVERKER